jgi:transposase
LNKGPKVRKYDKLSMMTGSPLQRAYTWLEPDEGKLSCPVLRGGSVSNDALLPDFDRLAERVKAVIGQDPLSNNLFVFRSRRGDRLKILTWDRDGFVLWYKRLESGVFKLPRLDAGTRSIELRASELAMILDGIDMSKLKRVPRYERAAGTNKNNLQRVTA